MLGPAVSGVKGHDKDRYEKYDEDYGPEEALEAVITAFVTMSQTGV